MKIGIDIDNVISNFNEVLLEEYLIHDKEIGKRGIINKNAEYHSKLKQIVKIRARSLLKDYV